MVVAEETVGSVQKGVKALSKVLGRREPRGHGPGREAGGVSVGTWVVGRMCSAQKTRVWLHGKERHGNGLTVRLERKWPGRDLGQHWCVGS